MDLFGLLRRYGPLATEVWRRRDRLLAQGERVRPALPHLAAAYKAIEPNLPDLYGEGRALLLELWPFAAQAFDWSVPPPAIFTARWTQESLNEVMGHSLKLDGKLGDRTQSSVRDFQRRMVDEGRDGWTEDDVDGIPGPKTCLTLWQVRHAQQREESRGAAR